MAPDADPPDRAEVRTVVDANGVRGYASVRHGSLAGMLRGTVAEHADGTAFIDERRSVRWSDLESEVETLAARLMTQGVTAGDRIGLLFGNGIPYVVAAWASWRIGAVIVPINTRLLPAEMVPLVRDADVALVLADAALGAPGELLAAELGIVVAHADEEDGLLADVEPSPSLPPVPEDPGAPAAIMYTSGTTGQPKGVVVSHRNFLENSRTCIDVIGRRSSDVELICVPQFNVTGLGSQTIPVVDAGMTGILVPRFDVPLVLGAIAEHRVTSSVCAPTMWWRILEHPEFAATDVSSFRLALFGGAPMPTSLLRRLQEAFPGAGFGNGYGMTETCSMVTYVGGEEILAHVDSVGRALPITELRIVDPRSGSDVADGASGELWFRGAQVATAGYWRNPQATATLFTQDGWLRSGDVGMRSDSGVIVLQDRIKDVIKRGGESIYSFEVENVLHQHPAVLEAAVFGLPDEVYGETVAAAVAVKPGLTLDESTVRAFCAEQIARFKTPKRVLFVEALPRNAGGKVLKAQLRERMVAA